jgi:hypothetical protein
MEIFGSGIRDRKIRIRDKHYGSSTPGFRIRIDLMRIRIRIRIQHFFELRIRIPDPDPGFDDLNWKKIYS